MSRNLSVLNKFKCLYLTLQIFSVADDDGDQSGEGEEEKDAVSYCISNEVHFTNPKMTRYDSSNFQISVTYALCCIVLFILGGCSKEAINFKGYGRRRRHRHHHESNVFFDIIFAVYVLACLPALLRE
jgi:hypothetical protein